MPRAAPLPADERRAAIMAATEPLLEEHGRAVSTRQIAEAAGIAEGTIFRVFTGKEALIDAVLEDVFDVRTTCSDLAGIDPEGDLEHRLVQAVTVLQERLRRVFALFHALGLKRELSAQRDFRAKQDRDNALIDAALTGLLAPDRRLLSLPPADAAGLLRCLTLATGHPVLSDQRHSEPKQVVDLLLHGITVRPTPEGAPRC